jgi:sugar phosphate isomerase/epimerase
VGTAWTDTGLLLGAASGSRALTAGDGTVPLVLAAHDLVLCAGTVPRAGWVDKAGAASAAGFRGVSVRPTEVDRAREDDRSLAELRAILDDHGLHVAELDPLTRWLPGSGPDGLDARGQAMYRRSLDELVGMAVMLGARSINVIEAYGAAVGTTVPVEAAAEAFATVCDQAAAAELLVHLEHYPWSGIPDLATAWAVVELADRPNGGLLVDTWHLARTAPDGALMALATVPGHKVLGIQVSDGPHEPAGDVRAEAVHGRHLPGDGDMPIAAMIGALRATGCQAPVGVEVMSSELAARPPAEAAALAAQATRAVLHQLSH